MKTYLNQQEDNILNRIAYHLLLSSHLINEPGLFYGKMGVVIFFAHYYQYTNERMYIDFAGELLDEIFEEIDENTPICFDKGLCGIGWGVEYLLQNKFMKGDSNEILNDIDNKVMELDPIKIINKSVKTGLEGILYYINIRLMSPCEKNNSIFFDPNYLKKKEQVDEKFTVPDKKEILLNIPQFIPKGTNFLEWNLGLYNGCAGYGIKNILE